MTGLALRGVALGQRLAFQNVVSSRSTFDFSEMASAFNGFASRVAASGFEPRGPLFYSLNNVPMDEMVDVEMFLPVQETVFSGEAGFRFHSYFEVFPVLQGVVTGDFESQTERVYAQLLATLAANDLDINSPFFHTFYGDVSPYGVVSVGYVERGSAVRRELDGADGHPESLVGLERLQREKAGGSWG